MTRGLAELEPTELVAVLPGRLPAPESLAPHDWLYVVGLLATRIIEGSDRLGPLDWEAASRAVLHALATAERAGGIDHREYVTRRLYLTAALLQRVTPNPDVVIRNPAAALALLFDNLPLSLDEAHRLAPRWQDLDVSEILRLRTVKNLLTPGLLINVHAPDPRLDGWTEVHPLKHLDRAENEAGHVRADAHYQFDSAAVLRWITTVEATRRIARLPAANHLEAVRPGKSPRLERAVGRGHEPCHRS